MPDQSENLDLRSHAIAEDKQADLLRLFPEIRTEGGKVDFDRLKLALGETVDVGKERYGMNWPGKADCFKTLQTPSLGTLRPCPEESWPPKPFFARGDAEGAEKGKEDKPSHSSSANSASPRDSEFNTSENLIIEGDNLEVLKLLQKSYLGKVKMIYIDPPYNTGNDFIYPDNYSESLQTYLEYTGQVDKERRRFSTNTDTDGRFHSKWLNMMYPRLYLARNLLREDGVIFISIDDSEYSNLKKLCDDIFGEENFISTISRLMKSGGAKGNFFTPNVDFILVYVRNIEDTAYFRSAIRQEQIDRYYNKTETDGSKKGEIYGEERLYKASLDPRPNQRFWVKCPDGSFAIPPGKSFPKAISHGEKIAPTSEDGVWKWIFSRYEEERAAGNIIFKQTSTSALVNERGEQSVWNIYNKLWLSDQQEKGLVPSNLIDQFENRQSAAELKELDIPFDFAKPSSLMKYLLEISRTSANDLIVDFFAGSGTTANAALDLNKQDSANRKFILVQLPEPCDSESAAFKAGYKTIADITKERVRRVIKKLNEEGANKLDLDGAQKQDRGFRVFKLAESNFKPWNAEMKQDPAALAQQLDLHVDHIRDGRSAQDLLYELMFKSGFPLTAPVEKLSLAGKEVYSVAGGGLFICLERELTLELIRAIAEKKPQRVVCLDQGFAGNDQLKTNAVQIFKTKGVAKFQTV